MCSAGPRNVLGLSYDTMILSLSLYVRMYVLVRSRQHGELETSKKRSPAGRGGRTDAFETLSIRGGGQRQVSVFSERFGTKRSVRLVRLQKQQQVT